MDYARHCVSLGRSVGIAAEDRLGLKLIQSGGSEEGIHEQYIMWLCRLAIESASGKRESVDLPLKIAVPALEYGGSTLVTSQDEVKLSAAETLFRGQLQVLSRDPPVQKIAQEKAGSVGQGRNGSQPGFGCRKD